MKTNNHNSNRGPAAGILIFLGIVAAAFLISKAVRRADVLGKKEELKEWVSSYGDIMEENVPKDPGENPYFQEAEIRADAEMSYDARNKWQRLEENVVVILHADRAFDILTDASKYSWLKWESEEYGQRIGKVHREQLQEYENLVRFFGTVDERKGIQWEDSVFRDSSWRFIIETGLNTYEWTPLVRDYYILNDEGHYVKYGVSYEALPTPTPKPESSSGSSGGTSNPKEKPLYNDPADFDDPEEYADEAWGTDFDDWDEAYEYWENY